MDTEALAARLRAELESLKDPEHGFILASRPRFERLFGRDSLVVAWQRLEHQPEIAAATLRILARLQGKKDDPEREEEPGKILHEWAPEPVPWVRWEFPYYGSVDATPLFVLVAAWTVRRVVDERLRDELWPHVEAACGWMARTMDADRHGLLSYAPRAKVTLRHQGWKDSGDLGPENPTAIVEAQGYAYAAFLHAAAWADDLAPGRAAEWRERADRLKETFNKLFWMPTSSTYALAIQGDGEWFAAVASNPGHLLFTGIVHPSRAALVVEKLFSGSLWTPYGIRTLSIKDAKFDALSYHRGSIWPHDNWIISEGLRVLGMEDRRSVIRNALLNAHEALGKLPELYAVHFNQLEEIPRAQHPQAWASGALLNLLDSSLDPKTALRLSP